MLWALSLVKVCLSESNSAHLEAWEGYTASYSDNFAVEIAILGVVSFTLTILNIVCIFLMGVLVLKVR